MNRGLVATALKCGFGGASGIFSWSPAVKIHVDKWVYVTIFSIILANILWEAHAEDSWTSIANSVPLFSAVGIRE